MATRRTTIPVFYQAFAGGKEGDEREGDLSSTFHAVSEPHRKLEG
jgi:hypothetical protein